MMMMASVSGVNGHKKSEKISQIQKCVTGSEFTQQRVHTHHSYGSGKSTGLILMVPKKSTTIEIQYYRVHSSYYYFILWQIRNKHS